MSRGFEIDIKPEECFRLSNGRILKNLYELMNALESMDDDTFRYHVNKNKNDFENWIRYVFKDGELANLISNSQTREGIMESIGMRLFEPNKKGKPKKNSQKATPQYDKIEEILMKEKEIEKREEKIGEVEAKIEKELADLSAKKETKFLSKEFIQGLLIGLLSALVIGLIYIKFFA